MWNVGHLCPNTCANSPWVMKFRFVLIKGTVGLIIASYYSITTWTELQKSTTKMTSTS